MNPHVGLIVSKSFRRNLERYETVGFWAFIPIV